MIRIVRGPALAVLFATLAACASSGSQEPTGASASDRLAAIALPDAAGGDAPAEPAAQTAADSRATGAAPAAAEGIVANGTREGRRGKDRRQSRRRRGDPEPEEAGEQVVPEVVPAAALASHERAIAAIEAEDWVEAELELEQLIAAYPEYPGPYVNLAIVYRHDRRDELARETLEKALAIDPMNPAANNRLGMLLREAGEFDAAEAAYRRAVEADPDYSLAWYNLGVLLDLYLGRRGEALTAYETFQSLNAEPDAEVGRWIIDLRRRLGDAAPPERVARENGP